MICQSCNQNLATVHLTEIVQKAKKETHLCEECAKSKGITHNPQFSVKGFLGGLSKAKPEAPQPAESEPVLATSEENFEPCPSCGMTFGDFRQSGRLGCHNDYDHFKRGLTPLFKKIHGAIQHTGRVPAKIGERIERQRLISRYQGELKKAVDEENYEKAAEVRDSLKAIQQEKP